MKVKKNTFKENTSIFILSLISIYNYRVAFNKFENKTRIFEIYNAK